MKIFLSQMYRPNCVPLVKELQSFVFKNAYDGGVSVWVESCLPKIHVKVLPPRISDCDLTWNKVVADVASYDEVILE